MKRKKKVLVFLVLVLVAALAFAGCGDKGGQESGESTNTAQESWVLPEQPEAGSGLTSFATLDLFGEQKDPSMFADYKYTLVNVWGTYCNPCIRVMPETEKLYQEYKDKGLGVAAIVVDTRDDSGAVSMEQVEYAQQLVDQQGVTYPNLLPSDSLMADLLSRVSVTPSYFFVDSKGEIVSSIYEGGRSDDEWGKIIEQETGI